MAEAFSGSARSYAAGGHSIDHPAEWHAHLQLQFSVLDGKLGRKRTVISKRRHNGPLVVQRPFYPEGQEVCHLYLLHPPGGIAGGDRLRLDAEIKQGAHVLVTTPGATKFYRSELNSSQDQSWCVAEHAILEWLPQETILYDGSRAQIKTRIDLEPGGHVLAWEISVLGRPAAREGFLSAHCQQQFEIWQIQDNRSHQPLWLERSHWEGGSPLLHAPWGLSGYTCAGSFVSNVNMTGTAVFADVQTLATRFSTFDSLCSVSQLHGVMLCRYLGRHAQQAKDYFTEVWRIIRPAMLHRSACVPRIWNT